MMDGCHTSNGESTGYASLCTIPDYTPELCRWFCVPHEPTFFYYLPPCLSWMVDGCQHEVAR